MSTTRRRSSRSWMHGISRMRLPMSAKFPAICAILSANGFGMKCVHASMRIMRGSSTFYWMPRPGCRAGVERQAGVRSGVTRKGHADGAVVKYALLSRVRTNPDSTGAFASSAPLVELVADPDESSVERLQVLCGHSAGAEEALAPRLLLLAQRRARRGEADAHVALVGAVARAPHQAHRLQPLEQRRQGP